MEYTLHKLSEGFIITSDEDIKKEDKVLLKDKVLNVLSFNEGVLEEHLNKYGNSLSTCYNVKIGDFVCFPESLKGKKVIAQQDQIDFSALKLEDQKEIGRFDVEKFALDSYNKSYPNYEPVTDYKLVEKYRSVEQFNNGFQKAQELLSDRSFTLEDIERAMIEGLSIEKFWEKCVQSLSQPKSWKVELEMKDSFRANEETYIDDSGVKGNYSTHSKKPKLTNGKIKITKIL